MKPWVLFIPVLRHRVETIGLKEMVKTIAEAGKEVEGK